MDGAIVGVIIGSVLSLLGTVINQIISSRKEQKQWENQQASESIAWARDEQRKEKEFLREIYQHGLRSLSVFIALSEQEQQDGEEGGKQKKLELIDDIHKWVTMLLLRHGSSNLDKALTEFTSWPDEHQARSLRNEIVSLSNKEEGFFLKELRSNTEDAAKHVDPDVRQIQIKISDIYRREQLIEGTEIPQSFSFDFRLSEMTNSQREKLADIFFESHKSIPAKVNLYIPVHRSGRKQIDAQGKQWEAQLNPSEKEPRLILASWEEDFERSLKSAKESLEAQVKESDRE